MLPRVYFGLASLGILTLLRQHRMSHNFCFLKTKFRWGLSVIVRWQGACHAVRCLPRRDFLRQRVGWVLSISDDGVLARESERSEMNVGVLKRKQQHSEHAMGNFAPSVSEMGPQVRLCWFAFIKRRGSRWQAQRSRRLSSRESGVRMCIQKVLPDYWDLVGAAVRSGRIGKLPFEN